MYVIMEDVSPILLHVMQRGRMNVACDNSLCSSFSTCFCFSGSSRHFILAVFGFVLVGSPLFMDNAMLRNRAPHLQGILGILCAIVSLSRPLLLKRLKPRC